MMVSWLIESIHPAPLDHVRAVVVVAPTADAAWEALRESLSGYTWAELGDTEEYVITWWGGDHSGTSG